MSEELPHITVVLAAESGSEDPRTAVLEIRRACEGLRAEILVIWAGVDAPPALPSGAQVVHARPTDLVPHLWARGIAVARGEAVALTTTHFRVGATWPHALMAGLADGAAGVGGPIRLAPDAGHVGRAAYFLRYSAFMADVAAQGLAEIAGDNAAYARADLARHMDSLRDGFWEVEFHRRLREEGRWLAFSPDAGVAMARAPGFRAFLRNRFRHGTQSGRYRTEALGIPLWRSLAAAPLVPLVLLARILRRARAVPGALPQAVRAVPLILPMAAAWALGEAAGAWTARPGRVRATPSVD